MLVLRVCGLTFSLFSSCFARRVIFLYEGGITSSSSVTWYRSIMVSFNDMTLFSYIWLTKIIIQLVGRSLTLSWKQRQFTISSCPYDKRMESNRSLSLSWLKVLREVMLLQYVPQIGLGDVGADVLGVGRSKAFIHFLENYIIETD